MTDKKFQGLLNKVSLAHEKYDSLLREAEEEYHRRFGFYPGDIDDDFWIDSFHQSPIGATVEQVTISAKSRL